MAVSTLRGLTRFVPWGLLIVLTALGFGQLPDILDPDNRCPIVLGKTFAWEAHIEKGAAPRLPYVPMVDG